MVTINKKIVSVWLIVILSFISVSCSPGVTVIRPTSDVSLPDHVTSVAISSLTGPLAAQLREAIRATISHNPRLQLVDSGPGAVIISGQVESGLEDSSGRDLVKTEQITDQKTEIVTRDLFINKDFTITKPVVKIGTEEADFLIRRAFLTFTCTLLIPSRDGSKSISKTIKINYEDKYGGINEFNRTGPKLADLPAPEATNQHLVREAAFKLAETLAPTRYVAILDLGSGLLGEEDIRLGVDLAKEGRWKEAEAIWQGIVDLNPDHPAALYNIGVARERLGDQGNLIRANEAYTKAARLGNNPLYREAMTRTTLILRQNEAAMGSKP
ncbi:MAG: tetratricopeptide repeat protein [Deltaproteobacteria bacterium]|nr:tetratricopeptide repeat protein [Deltaproteobacteria bacterium]